MTHAPPACDQAPRTYAVEALKSARRIQRTVLVLSLACLVLGISRPRGHEPALRELSALLAYDPSDLVAVADGLDAERRKTEASLLEVLRRSPQVSGVEELRVVCGGKPRGPIWWGGLRERTLDEVIAALEPYRWRWFRPDSMGLVALLDTLSLANCPRTLRQVTLSFETWPPPGRAMGLATFEFTDDQGVEECRPAGWRQPAEANWLQGAIDGEVRQEEWQPLEWLRTTPMGRTLLDDHERLLPRLQDHPKWEEWRNLRVEEALEAILEAAEPSGETVAVIGLHMKSAVARWIAPGLLAALIFVMWTHLRSVDGGSPPAGVPAWIPWEPLMVGWAARAVDAASLVLVLWAVWSVLDPPWAALGNLWILVFWCLCQVEFNRLRAKG